MTRCGRSISSCAGAPRRATGLRGSRTADAGLGEATQRQGRARAEPSWSPVLIVVRDKGARCNLDDDGAIGVTAGHWPLRDLRQDRLGWDGYGALRPADRRCGLLAYGGHQAAAPAPRRGPRVSLDDVPRRGAPGRAHPPPQRRADARRGRRRGRAAPRHGVRARRVALAPASGARPRRRAARAAAHCERHRDRARSTGCTQHTRRRAITASRSASCTATCPRRTSWSASTAWRA